MDCLGKEVTHKMKSAIMAKLMELGIKADVDLLEYIMLMISNKRTKAGMIRDLSLFLGSCTTPFVTWLHQVLSKLQEVTISTQVNPPKPTKTENVSSEKAHENAEAKLPDTVVKCKKRERTPSGEDQDYLNIRADTEADPIDDLQSVIDESAAKSSLTTEKKEPERAISTKPGSNKIKDSQSSKTSTSSEKQKSLEEQSKDDGGAKRKMISPPVKEREKELLKDEGDAKKRRVSPLKVKERESVRDDSELRRKRLSSPIAKEREKEASKDDSEVKKKRISSPLRESDREMLKDDAELKRKRLSSPAKEKEFKDDVELRRKRLVSPSKESLKDDGVLRRRRLSPDRVKDGDKRSGSESGRKDKPLYDVRELLNKRKAEKSAVPDEKRGREGERRRKSPRRPVSERERYPDRKRDRERMRERVRERENQKRSSSRELSSDRRRPPSKVVRVESSVHDVSEARSSRSNFPDRDRSRKASSSGGESARGESDRERERDAASVSSVVKVTPRPVRPTNQQPSSSLILKAMAEANKSLAKQGAATKPANTAANRKTDPILRGRISPEKITITLTNNRVQPLTKEDKENKIYVPSNGRDESYERLKQSRAMMRRSTADDSKRKDSETDLSTTNSGEQKERTRLATNNTKTMADERGVVEEEEDDDEVELDIGDTRLEYESELEEDRVERKERKRSETNSSPRPRSLSYGSDNGKANDEVKKWLGTADVRNSLNESKLSLETDSEPVLEICPNTSELEVDEPEFVVTLNGLNSTMYSCISDDDEDLLHESSRYDHNYNEESEKRNRSANIVIQPEEPSKQDMSQTDAIESTQTSIPKSLDRCRYWPSCLAGDKCSYFHPTAMCKMFPSCKFGDHCLYIHPPCKFGVACTRRDCAYRHPSKPLLAKATLSLMPPSPAITNCRFFPNCTNPACPFFHPKPCRFGTYCTKKNCVFDHTVRLSQNKLKWIRQE